MRAIPSSSVHRAFQLRACMLRTCMTAVIAAALCCACQRPAAPVIPIAPSTQTPAPVAPAPTVSSPPESPKADIDDHAAVNATIANVLGDHAAYERAVAMLQQAVARKDAAAVAAMVEYPFTARIDGKPVRIADAAAFAARYDDIVTPAIASAIVSQRYQALFVNAKGVMFGDGEAWLNGICADAACKSVDVRVVAIQPAQ
jgi:hypothetical protein